jgi:XrtJ-associated TM-motif-TM protein
MKTAAICLALGMTFLAARTARAELQEWSTNNSDATSSLSSSDSSDASTRPNPDASGLGCDCDGGGDACSPENPTVILAGLAGLVFAGNTVRTRLRAKRAPLKAN